MQWRAGRDAGVVAAGRLSSRQDQHPLANEEMEVTGAGLEPRSALPQVEAAMFDSHLVLICTVSLCL